MTRSLAAPDRSALIRLASSLPKGSEERRTILAGLSKTAGPVGQALAKMRNDTKTSFSSPSGSVHIHVWFDSGMAQDDFGRPVKDSGEWQVIVTTSPDPLNLSPRGKELARKTFRYVEKQTRPWVLDDAEKFIVQTMARYRSASLSKNAGKTVFPISALSKGGGTVGPAEIQRAVARAGFTKSYLEGLDFTHIEFDAVEKAVTVPGEGVEAIWRVFPKGQFDNRNSDYVWGTVTLSMQSSPAGIHVVGIIMVKD